MGKNKLASRGSGRKNGRKFCGGYIFVYECSMRTVEYLKKWNASMPNKGTNKLYDLYECRRADGIQLKSEEGGIGAQEGWEILAFGLMLKHGASRRSKGEKTRWHRRERGRGARRAFKWRCCAAGRTHAWWPSSCASRTSPPSPFRRSSRPAACCASSAAPSHSSEALLAVLFRSGEEIIKKNLGKHRCAVPHPPSSFHLRKLHIIHHDASSPCSSSLCLVHASRSRC